MGITVTDEQRAFTEAVRDLAHQECGTREQRAALTVHGAHAHNAELVIAMTYGL